MPASPLTLTKLYRAITKDQAAPPRAIAAALKRQNAKRRQVVSLYLRGMSDREVGQATHRSYGAARDMLRLCMLAIYKELAGLPRYHIRGRRRTSLREARKRTLREQLGLPTVTTRQVLAQLDAEASSRPRPK